MTASITWTGTVTARTSISHGGETRGLISMLRREAIIQPDGTTAMVPVISGNSFRGRLRRVGEELLRDVLHYEGRLSPAAAHALRSGGALAKTSGEPLSGSRLATLRALVPHIGVFGAAAGGRIIDGCLQVGKLIPHVVETAHLTGHPTTATAFDVIQVETYTHSDEANDHDAATAPAADAPPPDSQQMMFRVETFRAGLTFDAQLHLQRPTDIEAAFFAAVLDTYSRRALIGGRAAIGHGHLTITLEPTRPVPQVDWRTQLADHANDALQALETLR